MMKMGLRFALTKALLLITVAAAATTTAPAQTQEGGSAVQLRAQLLDVQAKEAELQERTRQLDEELKPENIERSLALNGSTRPEELRDQRRRLLENEKERVRVQLDQLAASRVRLEAAISTADAEAYRRSAVVPVASPSTTQTSTGSVQQGGVQTARPAQQKQRRRSARRQRPRRRRS
jgi:hypothetical protein